MNREMTKLGIRAAASGGDSFFPSDDAKDFARGARFIPGDVTLARRAGQPVNFNSSCSSPCCWFWEFQDANPTRKRVAKTASNTYYGHSRLDMGYEVDMQGNMYAGGRNYIKPGQRIYHFDRYTMEMLQRDHNGKCPECGNTHITGATGVPLEKA